MLACINPRARTPDRVAILTRERCGHCAIAEALLTGLGYDYAEIALPHAQRIGFVGAVTGEPTVPRVFVSQADRRARSARTPGTQGRPMRAVFGGRRPSGFLRL